MDPEATLTRLADALNSGDTLEAHAAAVDLHTWLIGGGFAPGDRQAWARVLLELAKLLPC